MPRILRVLHLSDLHFARNDASYDQCIVMRSVIHDAASIKSTIGDIDLVIFSGDLVQRGDLSELFTECVSTFVTPLMTSINLDMSKFLICPGNHDIDRNIVRKTKYIETGLHVELGSKDAVNAFVDQYWSSDPAQLPPAFSRLGNFFSTFWMPLDTSTTTFFCPFARIEKLHVNDIKVGVVLLNSAWRATGEPNDCDYGSLLIGERTIDKALDVLSECDIRIAVFHHPLEWLRPFDRDSVDARLEKHFDIVCTGHIHKNSPRAKSSPHGNIVLSQGGCLYETRDFFNGYSILTVDIEQSEVEIKLREYSDERRAFVDAIRILENGSFVQPIGAGRGARTKPWLATMRTAAVHIRRLANEHLAIAGPYESNVDISSHYICPRLDERSQTRAEVGRIIGESDTHGVELEDVLKGQMNLAFVGAPDSGKTSLAHYIAVQAANDVCDVPRLPIVCRFSNLDNSVNAFWKLVRPYVNEIEETTITRAQVEKESTLVIIDDVDVLDVAKMACIQRLVKERAKCRFVLIIAAPTSGFGFILPTQLSGSWRVFNVRELSRMSIRKLSAGWLGAPADDAETQRTYRIVIDHIKRSGLPRTGYVVSLVLWYIKNRSQGELLNEAVLIQNVIDHLLNRMDYAASRRGEFDFTSKTIVLQELAYWMRMIGTPASKNDTVGFVIDFLKARALNYDAGMIISDFIDRGILHDHGGDVSFKYRRFQDFFFSGAIRDDQAKLKKIIEDPNWMRFARELDIFSARFRHEAWLLRMGEENVRHVMTLFATIDPNDVQNYLRSGPHLKYAQIFLGEMRKEPMSAERADKIMERAEYLAQESHKNPGEIKADHHDVSRDLQQAISAITIYSQLIRNLEFASMDEKERHVSYCIDSWERLLIYLLSSLRSAFEEIRSNPGLIAGSLEGESDFDANEILSKVEHLMKSVTPSVVADMAYNALCTEKLLEFFQRVCGNSGTSTLSRLLCTSLLLELNPLFALDQYKLLGRVRDLDKWTLWAVTQQLYLFYISRPLPDNIKREFEKLIADLEVELLGISKRTGAKGSIMQKIKRIASAKGMSQEE